MKKSFPRLVISLAIGLWFFAYGMPPGNATHQILVSINDQFVIEGNGGSCNTTNAGFIITLSQAPGHYGSVVVNYQTANGTATGGAAGSCPNDYQSTSGSVTFSSTQTERTILVPLFRDNTPEPDESFFVDLTSATNATIQDSRGEGRIVNDDAPPMSINDVTQAEGNSGTTTFPFTVTSAFPNINTMSVNYATSAGTATQGTTCGSGVDYLQASGTLTFSPGSTTRPVNVSVCGDGNFESNETFSVNLSGPTNATIADGSGQGTIQNDDAPPNQPPNAVDDTATTSEDSSVNVNVVANDADPDGNSFSVSSVTQPPNGSVTNNGDGTVTYAPDANFNGTDSFTYTICDNGSPSLCDTATATVTVTSVNDPPAAVDDSATTQRDAPVTINVVTNDTDVDGDSLSVTSVTDAPNGTVTNNGDGSVTYTPDPGFFGTDSFDYTVSDGNGGTDTGSVTVSVNDPPVAADDSASTDEDTPVTVDVLVNDTDADGDTLTVDSVTQPANGTSTINPDDTVTYTPDADFNGTDTFTYTVSDGNGGTDTATVTVSVGAVNDPPVAKDDAAATDEDTAVVIDVVANDTDPDGNLDPSSVSVTDGPANGSVTHHGDGTVTYTPSADFNGADSFSYEVCDSGSPSLCDTATVIVLVAAVNDPPVAADDSASTPEDTPVVIPVLDNDSDPDGDSLSVTSVTQPANGSATNNGDGTVTYAPDLNFSGTDSFTYTTCDDGSPSLCDTATVTVSVGAVNDPPVANDDVVATDEDTPVVIDVVANDTDPDGNLDPSSVTITGGPFSGTATNNGDGTVTYTPDADFNGSDSFSYEVCDSGTPSLCDTATVLIIVGAVNDSPVAADDSASTDEDTPVTVDVLANDSPGPANESSQALSVTSVTQPANGSATNNGDGTVTYAPDLNFSGIDSFTYTACDDGSPVVCDTATVTVTVGAANDPPVAANDSASTDEDTPVVISVLDNDSDPDGDTLSVDSVTQPANGTVVINPDDTVTYTPDGNFNGTDSFDYTISDGNGGTDTATVIISVGAVNDSPVAVDDSASTDEDTPVVIDVLANDTDPDGDSLTVTSVTQPANGSATNNGDGTVTYAPDLNFSGTDSFTYTACDDGTPVACDTATVTVTVGGVNDPPVANDDAAATDEDTPVTIDVVANDTDADGNLDPSSVSLTGGPSNGSVTNHEDGTVTYTPDADFNGTDSFSYEVCDSGTPSLCDTATVMITVGAVNDPPVAADDSASTDEDTPMVIPVLDNDSDPEGDSLSVDSVTQPANGTASPNGDGTVTYTPDPDFNGSDSFTYTACDDGSPSLCDTAAVSVAVGSVNDPPVASDDAATTAEDTPVDINALANDSDADGDTLTVSSVTQPANGTATVNPDNTVTYAPDPDFNGTDSFDYTISDGNGGTDTATVTVNVGAVNDPPVANDDSAATLSTVPVVIDVLANDTPGPADESGQSLTVASVTQPANGTVVINPDDTVTYVSDPLFVGIDTFTYTVCDDGTPSLCSTATVRVTVSLLNRSPVANDDTATTDEDTPVTINVVANDTDPDNNLDPSSVTITGGPFNGQATANGDGTVTYTPNPNFNGNDSFSYQVCDTLNACDTATVSITVVAVNDDPMANDDAAATLSGVPVTIDVLANDTDPDGDPLTITGVTQPSNGTVTVNPNNTVTYRSNCGFQGFDTFTYTISDGSGGTDTAQVAVRVRKTSRRPSLGC